jgi:hypothetical protein
MDSIPNKPPTLSIHSIQKLTNIEKLHILERNYDTFINDNAQLLMLYNILEDYLEIRDALTVRLSEVKRENNMRFYLNQYLLQE